MGKSAFRSRRLILKREILGHRSSLFPSKQLVDLRNIHRLSNKTQEIHQRTTQLIPELNDGCETEEKEKGFDGKRSLQRERDEDGGGGGESEGKVVDE